jgi:ferredoxin-NADP reductase
LREFEQRVGDGKDVKVKFLISNSFKRRAPFLDRFLNLENKGILTTELFFTKENTDNSRRISLFDIENVVKTMPEADFIVCGAISFTRDMWKMLKGCGVSEERIFTEAFF